MSLQIKRFLNPNEFRDAIYPFLLRQEARYCLPIGILDTMTKDPGIYPSFYFYAFLEKGQVVGASWRTPPFALGMTELSEEAMDLLIAEREHWTHPVTAINAPLSTTDIFFRKWRTFYPQTKEDRISQRIYQLDKVIMPKNISGKLRVAALEDRALLEEWNYFFLIDCRMPADREKVASITDHAIREGLRWIWEVDGQAVSMVSAQGNTPNGIRVSWVYTPPELRGHGYATQLVAVFSQKLLDEGKKFCFLYTDLDNPTSNSIYSKIGYRVVADAVHYELS